MANENHLEILKQGVDAWNRWRKENSAIQPELYSADLSGTNLFEADLSKANLSGANLTGANLFNANLDRANLAGAVLGEANLFGASLIEAKLHAADLSRKNLSNIFMSETGFAGKIYNGAVLSRAKLNKADLSKANLSGANLNGANLSEAILCEADLGGATLSGANLSGADLSGAGLNGTNLSGTDLTDADLTEADLQGSLLLGTNLQGANLTSCRIYGISAWDLNLEEATQKNLAITLSKEPSITVDNLEVAQFIYILLNNDKIRDVIDTITTKVVLILGRFTDERMMVLEAIQEELRNCGYVPVLFKFDKPASQSFIETIGTLAHLARFVIADVTEPKIVLEEVPHIVRNVAVPVKPLLEGSGNESLALPNLRRDEPVTLYNLRINHRSILDTHWYKDLDNLLTSFEEKVIAPAEAKAKELAQLKTEGEEL